MPATPHRVVNDHDSHETLLENRNDRFGGLAVRRRPSKLSKRKLSARRESHRSRRVLRLGRAARRAVAPRRTASRQGWPTADSSLGMHFVSRRCWRGAVRWAHENRHIPLHGRADSAPGHEDLGIFRWAKSGSPAMRRKSVADRNLRRRENQARRAKRAGKPVDQWPVLDLP